MLGWEVSVYRHAAMPPQQEPERLLLARWMTGVFGLRWLDDLVKAKKAEDLGGDGYPSSYSVTAGVLLPILSSGLPRNSSPPVVGEDYVLPAGWNSDLKLDLAGFSGCPGDERLFIDAWDLS